MQSRGILRWLVSLGAIFVMMAYVGVWATGLFIDKSKELSNVRALEPSRNVSEAEPILLLPAPASSEPLPERDLRGPQGFEMARTTTVPGGYLVLNVYGVAADIPMEISNPFGDPPRFYEVGDHLSALIPVHYDIEPGSYQLIARGGGHSEEFAILLEEYPFEVQNLRVDPSVVSGTVENDAANTEYFRDVQPLKFDADPHILWDGAFGFPLDPNASYRVTSTFGLLRTVNGKPSDRHGGIDYATNGGTPVLAANSGRVMFARFIALTGNTVMIEHGLGLKTWYYHMQSLDVSPGDIVAKGQQIGRVGTTGFSTGNHLHFAASIYNVYINPEPLMSQPPQV